MIKIISILLQQQNEKSVAYNVGYELGYFTGKYGLFIVFALLFLIVLFIWRKKRSKKN